MNVAKINLRQTKRNKQKKNELNNKNISRSWSCEYKQKI